MSIQSSILSRFSKNLANKKPSTLPLNVQTYEVAGQTARCVVQIDPVFRSRLTNDEIASAVSALMPSAQYLENSICVADRKSNLYTMFLSSTAKTMSAETAATAGVTEIAHNVFRDDDDCIWNKMEDASGVYFVAQGVEDFDSLIKGVRSRNIATASLEVAHAEGFDTGDMIAVYDAKAAGYRFGIAANHEMAYFYDEDRLEAVSPMNVAVNHERACKVEVATSATTKDILAYYRKLYGHSPAYFKQLESLIKSAMSV